MLLSLGLLFLTACTARVQAPYPVPEQASTVWLFEHGYHSTLVLPDGPGQLVLYEYGEWQWYALERTAWYRVFPVFLWPSQGSLSRRRLQMAEPIQTAALRRILQADQGWSLAVETERMKALRESLHQRFALYQGQALFDSGLQTWFVPDPVPYHLFRTCNHVMIAWLRDLGCQVRAALWTWNWQLSGALDWDG